MKKDIEIPIVENIEIVVLKEFNEDYLQDSWYAYLFNNSTSPIEAVMIVSKAEGTIDGEQRNSSLFRHAFKSLAPNESQKVELLEESIFQLDNTFMLTFFQEGKLFDKNYVFPANTIKEENATDLPFSTKKGILSK